MTRLLKQVLAGCVIIFAMSAQSMADALSDAQRAFDAGDYAKAATLYLPLAKQGNAAAQYSLGVVYTQGLVVLPDYREAMQWYLLAADQGHAQAQVKLGTMYAQGKWIPQNYRKAVQMFQSAADKKDALGELNLGDMYAQGHGVLQDVQRAIEWYQRAADQGNALAQYKLGQIYSDGRDVAQDNDVAYKWFNLAAANAADDASHAKYIERRDWAARQLAAQILLKAQQEADARAQAERDAIAAQLPPASLSETAPEHVRQAEAQAEPVHEPPAASKSRSAKKRKAVLAKDGLKGKDGRTKPKAKTAYIKVKIIPDKAAVSATQEDAAAQQKIGDPAGIINTSADHAPETSPPVALEQAAPVTAEAPGVEAGQLMPATTEAPKVEIQQAVPATAEAPSVEAGQMMPATTEAPKVEVEQTAPATVEAPSVQAGQVVPVVTETPKAEVQQAASAAAEVSNVEAGIVAPPSSEAVPEAEIKPKTNIPEETAGAIINPPAQ